MALTKHASFVVLAAKIAPAGGGPLMRTAHRHEFDYEPKPGFLYVRSRMISSRCNDNYDEFPAEEIKTAYRTFVGKPVFVNHNNDNHRRARGVIKDAVLHEDRNPDGTPDIWVEGLMEVDAVRFPKLAQAIIAGHIDRTSMGTDVAYSICSACGNKASSPVEYCAHIPRMKGKRIYRRTASGTQEGILVREVCYGLRFFENSLLVEEPADPTAYFLGVDTRGVEGMVMAASRKTAAALNYDLTLACGDHARYVGTQPNQIEVGKDWQCSTHGDTTVTDVGGPGSYDKGLGWDVQSAKTTRTASKTANAPGSNDEKVVAPAEVDTLREEQCPVCGEQDSYDGAACQVCGFISPPDEFGDPDLDKAKQTDLRQDSDDAKNQGGDLACDNCGATFSSTPTPAAKQAVVLDPDNNPASEDEPTAEVQAKAGDSCPECGEGTLQPSTDAAVDPAADPAGLDADGFAPAGSAEEDHAADPDASDDTDDQDGKDGDDKKPDFLKDKKKDSKKPTASRSRVSDVEGVDVDMRPALAALAQQQKQIEALKNGLAFVAEVAGLSQHPRITSALKVQAVDDNPAFGGGWDLDKPVEAAPEAPSESTDQAAAPQATTDVEAVGNGPLTDVAPDTTTSLGDTGTVLDVPLTLDDAEVTAPVAGTDTLGKGAPGEAGTNRVETEIRTGTPTDNSAAFRDGGFLGAKDDSRVMAGLRLARLRIQAGTASSADDITLATQIANDASLSSEAIATEISTLSNVLQAAASRRTPTSRSLVPQSARQASRMVPSMSGEPSIPEMPLTGSVSDEAFAFEG